MSVKDVIVSWFIRNVIIPKHEKIDIPGYITEKNLGYIFLKVEWQAYGPRFETRA